jgi:hypothetical protein
LDQQRRAQEQQRQQQQRVWQQGRGNNRESFERQQREELRRRQWQTVQQQRGDRYRHDWQRRQNLAAQRQRILEQQRRRAQLRFQQRYLERLRQDQLRLQNWRYRDYSPYNYRYYRGGTYYETNQYGAEMLRRAVNYGYEEGYRAGQADREDGWGFNSEDAYGYQDASYGYDSYYVDLSEYNYYFREGFRRGYEDGYYSRSQYGNYSNGRFGILGAILEQILNLQLY